MEFTQSAITNTYYTGFESSPNANILNSILNKRAIQGIGVISSFNSNGLICDFSSGLSPEEKPHVDEFLELYFTSSNLLNETTCKNTQLIVDTISQNHKQFFDLNNLETYDVIDFIFTVEQINTKHYNLFKCLQFALILSKLEQMELFLKDNYGPDMTLKSDELNAKSVSSFSDLYNFMMEKVRKKFYKLMETAPSPLWSRMQLNSNKQIWALMWNVYANEFAYLYDVEKTNKISESDMEELFKKLCGYYTEIDSNGKTVEKFANPDYMEKFNTFTEISSSAKTKFYSYVNSLDSDNKIEKEEYQTIAEKITEEIVQELDEPNATYAKKYIPITLEMEINMCTLLDATSNALGVFATCLEKEISNFQNFKIN